MAALRYVRRAPRRRHRTQIRLVAARVVFAQQTVLPKRRHHAGERERRDQPRTPRRDRRRERRRVGARSERSREARTTVRAGEARMTTLPNRAGYFGDFGGKYVPETLMAALDEFESAYRKLRRDRAFRAELDDVLANFVGRPTPITE